jgi:hypothetical protein
VNNHNLSTARDRQIAATAVGAFGAFGAVPVALLALAEAQSGSVGPMTTASAVIVGAGILTCVLPMWRPVAAAFCALLTTGAMGLLALDAYPSPVVAILLFPAIEFAISAGLALDAHRLRASAS